MKVIDLLMVLYPLTEIEFFHSSGVSMCFCTDFLDVPGDFYHKEIDQVSTNEHGTLEILLK